MSDDYVALVHPGRQWGFISKRRPSAYVAGPMSGNPDYRDQFRDVAMKLRDRGYVVFDPGEVSDFSAEMSYEAYTRNDFRAVMHCDIVVVLPGWENSTGATMEVALARFLKIPVLASATMTEIGDTYAGRITKGANCGHHEHGREQLRQCSSS